MRSIRKYLRRATLAGAAALFAAAGLATPSHAAPFGAGNLVVYRVGTGSAALTNAATATFLDEYTTAGVPQQTIALPTAVVGANKRVTASGTATSEGLISRSADGCSVVFTGYDAAPGTATVVSTTSTAVNRVVGKVDGTGSVDTSTALTNVYSTNNIRSATTDAGARFWAGGVGSATDGGINFAASVGATTATQLNNTAINLRQSHIFNGQLYTSSGSGATRIAAVGSGLPTTAGQTITNLPGSAITSLTSPYGFLLLDRDGSAGLDTLYVADDGADVVHKLELSAGSWVARGTFALTGLDPRGLTGRIVGNGVELYVTEATTTLSKIVDSAPFGSNIVGVRTILATASANTAFRGVAFAPDACGPSEVVPEASMVVLLPLGALAVMGAAYVVLRPRKVLV